MSQTDTTSLSELIQAIQLSLQPYRGTTLPESPFGDAFPSADGTNDSIVHKSITEQSRRDSGISMGSNNSPSLKGGEFVPKRPHFNVDIAPPLSRANTLPQLDTKIAQSPVQQNPFFKSHPSPQSAHPTPTPLSKILKDRRQHSTTSIPTAPQFSARKGCILSQNCSIEATRFRASTEAGLPAWWCRYDNLVVFDGIETDDAGENIIKTRSSKGLAIANRRGKEEIIVVQLDCSHCRDILGLATWKYAVKVCSRSVCKVCTARCKEYWHRSLLLLDDNAPVYPTPTPPATSPVEEKPLPDLPLEAQIDQHQVALGNEPQVITENHDSRTADPATVEVVPELIPTIPAAHTESKPPEVNHLQPQADQLHISTDNPISSTTNPAIVDIVPEHTIPLTEMIPEPIPDDPRITFDSNQNP
jgi:hypothetical protein